MTLHINITAENITCGRAGDAEWCAVALAIKQLPNVDSCCVGDDDVEISYTDARAPGYYWLSEIGKTFVRKFDDDLGVSPIEIELIEKGR